MNKLIVGVVIALLVAVGIYVLWGVGGVFSEITGTVKVTDISGSEHQMHAPQITLSDSPIFVELMK